MKKVALHNLGCKVNAYEMEVVQQLLAENGYLIVPFAECADFYIVNTCSVTNIADRKSRQMLHKAKKQNPQAIVIAMGCYAQTDTEGASEDDCVDLIIGNNHKKDLIQIINQYVETVRKGDSETNDSFYLECNDKPLSDNSTNYNSKHSRNHNSKILSKTLQGTTVLDIATEKEYEALNLTRTAEHTRAYIKVQDGCNQFCSYCIIPYARGRVRSRQLSDVVSEIKGLAAKGYQEVVLTGIHLSSYGIDFSPKIDLLQLIREVHKIDGIRRIRLGSLEPRIVTKDFAKTLAGMEKICPHFHLSLQSGCDETLKRMNRRYDTSEYYEKVQILRKYFHQPALTTDVIVGFPGETQQEYEQTMDFLERISFFEIHVFKYSRRKGTRADTMPNQLTEAVKTDRSVQMIAIQNKRARAYREQFVNQTMEVLLEESRVIDDKVYQIGHTKEYVKAAVMTKNDLTNQIVSGHVRGMLTDEILELSQDIE